MTFVTFLSPPSMLAEPDPPARYRLGHYLRAVLSHPDDRDAWLDCVADADIYALWQELDGEILTHD
jgi:hypothetical protein